jgi:hypothetical protein
VAIELYESACPAPEGTGRLAACDGGANGERGCGRAQFPLVSSSTLGGKPLGPGQYFVALRGVAGAGLWTLTYHHVPIECAQQGVLTPATQTTFLAGNTCTHADNSAPTCSTHGEDDNYIVFKCPNHNLHFTTCDPQTASDTVLSAVLGSTASSGSTGICGLTSASKEVACGADLDATTCGRRPDSADINGVGGNEHGLVTVSVDTEKGCGAYMLGSDYKPVAESR